MVAVFVLGAATLGTVVINVKRNAMKKMSGSMFEDEARRAARSRVERSSRRERRSAFVRAADSAKWSAKLSAIAARAECAQSLGVRAGKKRPFPPRQHQAA